MTREAKIGMLTGLGVIVLIGVLLSNYLGDPKTGAPVSGASGSTGRMADLGVGDNYRQQVMQPIGPAAMNAAPATIQLPNGAAIASTLNNSAPAPTAPPAAFAVQRTQTAVAPIPAGPSVATFDNRMDNPPMISLAEPTVPVKALDPAKVPAPAPVTYTVAQGDSLGKIARKFYNSSKTSDIQRIVAANPAILKDATTPVVVGKKLIIPGVAAAAPVNPNLQPANIYLPGDLAKSAPTVDPNRKVQAPAPATPAKTTTYVVQSGDNLEKISRKLTPSKVSDTVQKLISLNNIKDPNNLQVGTKLKVPA